MDDIGLQPDFPSVKQEQLEDKHSLLRSKRKYPFGNDSFSEADARSIRQKLNSSLSREDTCQRPGPGGIRLTYIEGWRAIHEANQIFGFNGWSSKIVALELRFVDTNRGKFTACVSCTVRITLKDGSCREDRGGGVAENMRSKADAILKAEKEAVTDATKRTLKNFGLRLGLSLYDRAHVRDMRRPPSREPAEEHVKQVAKQHQTTPVATRPSPSSSARFPQTKQNNSPLTTPQQQQTFPHKVNANTLSNVSAENAIDNAFSAKRDEAIMRKQHQLQRARANQQKAVAAASNQAALNSFQSRQTLQAAAAAGRIPNAAQFAVGANYASSAQASVSNAFSAGLSVNGNHASAHLRHTNAAVSRAQNQAIKSIRNSALTGQQFMQARNVQQATASAMSSRGSNINRPPNSASNRARQNDVAASLGITTTVGMAQGVQNVNNITLETRSLNKAEIEELHAIAIADF